MRVTAYAIDPVTFTLPRPIGDARKPVIGRAGVYLILRLSTDTGLQGYGVTSILARPYAQDLIDSFVVGSDPDEVQGTWERMAKSLGDRVQSDPGVCPALALIDFALWDLKAKAEARPLWQLFGALKSEVEVYASGLDMGLSDQELGDFYRKQARRGIRGGKLKVNSHTKSNLRRLAIMQEALNLSGKPPRLMVDVNQTWPRSAAQRHIDDLTDQFALDWVEEPLPFDDLAGMSALARKVKTPIVTGENLRTLRQFEKLADHRISDILQIMPVTTGGFTPARRISAMAAERGLQISFINTPGSIAAPLAAAAPHGECMEFVDLGRGEALGWQSTIRNGRLILSSEPGLGITPSPARNGLEQPEPSYSGNEFC